jgi:hypothetical protein
MLCYLRLDRCFLKDWKDATLATGGCGEDVGADGNMPDQPPGHKDGETPSMMGASISSAILTPNLGTTQCGRMVPSTNPAANTRVK